MLFVFRQGVLINQGWEVKGAQGDASIARLAKFPMPQLCPAGFVFIWVDKVHVSPQRVPSCFAALSRNYSVQRMHTRAPVSSIGHAPAYSAWMITQPEV